MTAVSIHEDIGKLFRKTSTVTVFNDSVQLYEKTNNDIKTIVLDLPFIHTISKKARTRLSTRLSTKSKMPLMESIVEVQSKKGSSMLHYNESFRKESCTTVNILQPSFLKRSSLKIFPAPSTEQSGIKQSNRDNMVNTLKGVAQLAHSFCYRIYCNNMSPDRCCSRNVLGEEDC